MKPTIPNPKDLERAKALIKKSGKTPVNYAERQIKNAGKKKQKPKLRGKRK